MVKPRMKTKSKRQSCSLKYRIRKNVAAHNKKVKKQVKKNKLNGKVKQIRKDPGIPNSAPFKEQILREAQIQKEQEELARQQKREEQKNQTKKITLVEMKEQAMQRQKKFEEKEAMMEKLSKNPSLSLLSSENSRKAYYKEFKKVIDVSDVVIEVLDARDPLGCRCRDVESAILESSPNKKIILLLNKIDLVPKQNVEDWLKYLRNEFPTVAFKSSTQTQKDRLTQCKVPVKHLGANLLSNTSQCVGANNLLKLFSNYSRHKGTETSIVVGVVGYPNVGKSSVINSLKRAKSCGVGSTPGFTKTVQEVVITKNIKILDSPGIVMATGDNESAVVLRNCVKVESLDDPITPVDMILSRCDKHQMMMKYNIGNYEDTNGFLSLLAVRYGKLKKGGKPNVTAAAKSVLKDWNSGKICYYTRPPQRKNVHLESKIVTEMSEEFDWSSLDQINQQSLEEVTGAPSESHSVFLSSSVSTNQLMETSKAPVPVEYLEEDEDMMETDETQLGTISIDLSDKKKKSEENILKKKMKRIDSENMFAGVITKGSNLQVNKQMKDVIKSRKKAKKRADKLSDKLGASLNSAMDFGGAEDYNFDVDMELPN